MATERGVRRRLDGFDGLRACAALTVLAYHTSLFTGLARAGVLAPVLSELKAGVAIFFVISGFLLYLPYARAIICRSELPDWRAFARRRVVRIFPGYWAALTILALGPLAPTVQTPNWWRFYGLTQIYDPTTLKQGLGVAWSLSVEVTFYALLPVLAAWVARLSTGRDRDPARTQLWSIAGLAAGTLLLRGMLAMSLTGPITHAPTAATALPGMLDWFALGMGLAVIRTRWEASAPAAGWLAQLAARPLVCWLLAASLFALGIPWQHGDLFLPLYGLGTHVAIGLGSATFILPTVALSDAPATRAMRSPLALLRCRLMAWLGTISYGIYLWHLPILQALAGRTTPPASPVSPLVAVTLLAATVAGAIALGAASWYLVERPAQRRWRPRRATAAAVAA